MVKFLEKIVKEKKHSLELIKKEKSLDYLERILKNTNFLILKKELKKIKEFH